MAPIESVYTHRRLVSATLSATHSIGRILAPQDCVTLLRIDSVNPSGSKGNLNEYFTIDESFSQYSLVNSYLPTSVSSPTAYEERISDSYVLKGKLSILCNSTQLSLPIVTTTL